MEILCKNCGASLDGGDQSCMSCGAPIESEPEAAKKIIDFYFHKSGGLVFCAMICVSIVPWMLNALFMLKNNNVISPFVPCLTFVLGAAAAWIFLSAAVMQVKKTRFSPKNLCMTCAGLFIKGGAGALAVMLLFFTAGMYLAGDLERWQANSPFAVLLIILAAGLIEGFGVAFFMRLALKTEKKEAKGIQKLLVASAGFFAVLTVIPAALEHISPLFIWTYASVPAKTAGMMITVLLQWCVLQPIFFYNVSVSKDDKEETLRTGFGAVNKITAIASAAVLAATGVFTVIAAAPKNPSDMVMHQVGDMITQGDLYLIGGDLLSAAACYRYAAARYDAWNVVLSGSGSVWRAVRDMYNDTALQLIYTESNNTQERYLYSWLLTADCPAEFYIHYLDMIQDKEDKLIESGKAGGLDEETIERRKDILLYLILNDIWSGNVVKRSSFDDGQAAEMLKRLAEFDEELSIRKGVTVYSDLVANGGVLEIDMVKSAVTIAERHPESVYLQWMAMQLGSSYVNDLSPGNVYKEAAEAAVRYDKLFEKQNRDAPDYVMAAHKHEVALALMKCQRLAEAKEYLAETIKKYDYPSLRLLYISVLFRKNEFEECAQLAEAMYAKEGSMPEALGFAMLARVFNGEFTESLKHALLLSGAAQRDECLIAGDSLLYTYAQAISGEYVGDKRIPNYSKRFNVFSDEDKLLFENDKLLNNMILAFVKWQEKKYEEAEGHIEAALKIGSDWSNLHYIKGAILFEQGEHEAALDSFLESVSLNRINPGSWFMLGHVYDRLERYPESLHAFTTVIEYIPNSEHKLDHYGLAYHARKAIADLHKHMDKEAQR
ncbi:MAG: tetratricopeptide repeat protein [Defluviitaleaceae bacterium]|nr:tetratricopeptide repeat protein [Defluviitaleaceae bacterium]